MLRIPIGLALRRVEDILESILSHTLGEEDLAGRARRGILEAVKANLFGILGNTHDIHICAANLGDVTEVLDNAVLGMDGVCGVTGAAAPGADLVRPGGDDLAALYKNRNMDAGYMCLLEIGGAGVGKELL